MKRKNGPIIVGVTGGSASGKSRLSKYLKRRLGARASVLCMDWYYRDRAGLSDEQMKRVNFDHPLAIETPLLLRHLDLLCSGQPVHAPTYHYASHSRTGENRLVDPAPVLIIDGLFALCEPRVRARLDISVYIDVPADIRLVRRIRRDVEERGVGLEETLRLYEHCVRPMHEKFVGASAKGADFVWPQLKDDGFRKRLLDLIRKRLD
ncbi:MAG: uridine kinase [Elusimicrobiota bacterium]|jgi:uridine kinase